MTKKKQRLWISIERTFQIYWEALEKTIKMVYGGLIVLDTCIFSYGSSIATISKSLHRVETKLAKHFKTGLKTQQAIMCSLIRFSGRIINLAVMICFDVFFNIIIFLSYFIKNYQKLKPIFQNEKKIVKTFSPSNREHWSIKSKRASQTNPI